METFKESCATKITLLTAWQSAADIYYKAVAALARQIGTVTKPEYERLAKAAEDARQRSVEAQAKLETHVNEHGCRDRGGDGGEVAA